MNPQMVQSTADKIKAGRQAAMMPPVQEEPVEMEESVPGIGEVKALLSQVMGILDSMGEVE
jgi:hypothetical protein